MREVPAHTCRVTLDGLNESYPALVEEAWNGWACSWFTDEAAQRVASMVNNSDDPAYNDGTLSMQYHPDRFPAVLVNIPLG
jgi:hypothetical protein